MKIKSITVCAVIICAVFAGCTAKVSETARAQSADKDKDTQRSEYKPAIIPPGKGELLLFGDGRWAHLNVSSKNTGAQSLMVGTEGIPKNTRIPVHAHEEYEEVIFVHEGNVFLTLGDKRVRAETGTTMFIPPGTFHGVENTEKKDSTILFIFPEPEIAEFFRSVGYKKGEKPPSLTADDWKEIMQRHKMREPER